jgi:hypothetical protein
MLPITQLWKLSLECILCLLLLYSVPPSFFSLIQALTREQKIQRLSGWMELEDPRFPSSSRKLVSSLRREYFGASQFPNQFLRSETLRIIEEEGEEEEEIEEEKTSTVTTVGESPSEIYVLHAHTQHPPATAHVDGRTLRQSLNDPDGRPMKIALDDDTPITGMRRSDQKFKIAYCPQMISRLVLESIESLLGDSARLHRKKWHRKVSSLFRSIFCSSSNHNRPTSLESSTDWLLLRLYLAVSGGSPASSVVKWYATFITDTNATPIESRLVVVVVCFDTSGSIARVSGITSSKLAFRVMGG